MTESMIWVHNPCAPRAEQAPVPLAPRSARRAEVRLGLVDNGKPKARELLLLLAEALGERLPVVATELISKPSAANPLTDAEAAALAERVDLVVTGLGDCGACSAASLQDALLMERNSVPATVLITDVFVSHVARFSDVLGAPGYHHLVVPHPVATKSPEHLQLLARSVADAAVDQLMAAMPALTG